MNEQVIVKNNLRSHQTLLSKRNTIAQLLDPPIPQRAFSPASRQAADDMLASNQERLLVSANIETLKVNVSS